MRILSASCHLTGGEPVNRCCHDRTSAMLGYRRENRCTPLHFGTWPPLHHNSHILEPFDHYIFHSLVMSVTHSRHIPSTVRLPIAIKKYDDNCIVFCSSSPIYKLNIISLLSLTSFQKLNSNPSFFYIEIEKHSHSSEHWINAERNWSIPPSNN